jgi:hypothetical protein
LSSLSLMRLAILPLWMSGTSSSLTVTSLVSLMGEGVSL